MKNLHYQLQNQKLQNIILVFFIQCFIPINSFSTEIDDALNMAGENRNELEKVLNHFNDDPFKYNAACFLIENMIYQYSLERNESDAISDIYRDVSDNYTVTQRRGVFVNAVKDSPEERNYNDYLHIKTLSSEYLIDYIESVCDMYLATPWHNDYSFEIFADYILPYKLEDEKVTQWRNSVLSAFDSQVGTISYANGDVYEAEDYCSQATSIVEKQAASGGKYVLLSEGDIYTFKGVSVGDNCMLRLMLEYFNGNDSTSEIQVCIGKTSKTYDVLSTGNWSIKYHKNFKCDFDIKKGEYDIAIKVVKGSIGLDCFKLFLYDYYADCKVDFENKNYQIYNPSKKAYLSIDDKHSQYNKIIASSSADSAHLFNFSGNEYGFYGIVDRDVLSEKNALDLLNFQYDDYGEIILWNLLNTTNQMWAFVYCKKDMYRIVNRYNGKCLTTDGHNVYLLRYNAEKGQLWRIEVSDRSSVSEIERLKGHFDYVRGDVYELEKYAIDSIMIVEESTASNGAYLKLRQGESIVLDSIEINYDGVLSLSFQYFNGNNRGSEISVSVGAESNILLWDKSGSWKSKSNKTCDFEVKKGIYCVKIEARSSSIGLDMLELKLNDYKRDCPVDLQTDFEYTIVNPRFKVGLATDDGKSYYTNLIAKTDTGEYCRYGFSVNTQGYYKIIEAKKESNKRVLDLLNFQYEDYGKIIFWENNSNLNQEWAIIRSGEDVYRIVNRQSGKCLTTNGENVYLLRYNEDTGQLWKIKRKGQCDRIDEQMTPNSAVSVAARLTEELGDFDFYAYPNEYYNPSIPELMTYKSGSCIDEVRYVTSVNRTYGVPITCDYVLQWPFRNHRHWWNVLIDEDGHKIKYFFGQKPYENNYYDNYPKGKVFRKTYSINKDAVFFKEKNKYNVPPLLSDVYCKDVTSEYEDVFDVDVPIVQNKKSEKEIGYLCVFDNSKWVPIWNGDCDDEGCHFKDMTKRAMYLPVYYSYGKIIPFYYPFNIEESGQPVYRVPNNDSLINLTLNRKYPFIHYNAGLSNRVNGGIFEASNDSLFSNADVLWKVDFYVDGQYYERMIDSTKSYKYFRYRSPDNAFCNINEIMIYVNDSTPLQGRIIGTKGSYEDRGETLERAFDGNVLTGFNAPIASGAWVGYAFDTAVVIDKIGFLPRNDGNIIEPGNLYELEYYENGWISCGRKKAVNYQITFEDVPADALYILHNLTKGREERPFIYIDNKQEWW